MAETSPRARGPKTGAPRKSNQPLKIDRLPLAVHEAIVYLKNGPAYHTWAEIETISAEPFNPKWKEQAKGGFVNWEELPTAVLELFPNLRLPHTNLHRWYDLRVAQVTQETIARSAQAREIAAAFAKSIVAGNDDAVLNAARDQIMSILAEDATPKGRMVAAKALILLAEVMQGARANTIKERSVAVDEKKLQALEARERLAIAKLEKETEDLSRKASKGEVTDEDINRLRSRVFGLPPVADAKDGKA